MNRTTPLLAALAGVLFVSAAAAQDAARSADIDRYRDHVLKDPAPDPKDGAVRVTFLGTATLLFDDGETQLLTDGFLSRPSFLKVATGRIATDAKVVDAALGRAKADRVKAIFVAHSHYDHAFDVAHVANRTKATLHGSASTLNVGRGGDVPAGQLVEFAAGKEYTVGKFTVGVRKGKHSPPIKGINDDLGEPIERPLRQPARARDYKEGGAFDFVITHGGRTILVNASGGHVEGALDGVRADVAFLSVGALGLQTDAYRDAFYANTVGKVKPKLVVPVHWDNFFAPLSDELPGFAGTAVSFDFLIKRLKADGIRFGILQGFQSVTLFGEEGKK